MRQITHENKTSNAAISAAKRNGKIWYRRTSNNRWNGYIGALFCASTATLAECQKAMAAMYEEA